jgi:hypothetical protein
MRFTRMDDSFSLETVFEVRLSADEMLAIHTADPGVLSGTHLSIPEAINRLYAAAMVLERIEPSPYKSNLIKESDMEEVEVETAYS